MTTDPTTPATVQALLHRREFQRAISLAKRALLQEPDDARAVSCLFEALMAANQLGDARIVGERALKLVPDNLRLLLQLAQLEISMGEPERALAFLEAAPRDDRAAAALRAAAYDQLAQPSTAQVFRDFASGIADPSGCSGWLEYFSQQLAEHLEHHAIHYPGIPEAIRALQGGDFAEAGRHVEPWFTAARGSPAAVLALADWMLLQGDAKGAEEMLQSSALASEWAGAVANRKGDAALLLGHLGRARDQYRRATVLDAEDVNAWLDLTRTEVLLGDACGAARAARNALKGITSEETRDAVESFLLELEGGQPKGSPRAGIVGLTWWPGGGSILEMEVQRTDGGGVRVTGNAGEDLIDSAQVAFAYLRSRGLYGDSGVHVHFPGSTIRKDGGSAGVAIAAALFAAHDERHLVEGVGITGEITMDGRVYPVDGLRGKITAAHLHGLTMVCYPLANRSNLIEVPASVRRALRLVPLSHFRDLERVLWAPA